jgi:hypothetical protein
VPFHKQELQEAEPLVCARSFEMILLDLAWIAACTAIEFDVAHAQVSTLLEAVDPIQ